MNFFEVYQIRNWNNNHRRRPSVSRRFSAGHKVGNQVEGKGVNALTEFLAWVNSPVVNDRGTECPAEGGGVSVVNDRGTEHAAPDRPHQKERSWSSVTWWSSVSRHLSVPRRFSAGHKVGNQVEGKGVNALTEFLAEVRNPVVNDRGTECPAAGGGVSVVNDRGTEHAAPDRPHQKERIWTSVNWRPSVPRRNSVPRRFSAGHNGERPEEGKGVNALIVCTAAEGRHPVVNDRDTECTAADGGHPVVNDRGTEYAAAGGGNPVANDLGTEHTVVCGGDLDYHTPSHFGNMLDLRTPALQRRA
jgi:hypothetical protein